MAASPPITPIDALDDANPDDPPVSFMLDGEEAEDDAAAAAVTEGVATDIVGDDGNLSSGTAIAGSNKRSPTTPSFKNSCCNIISSFKSSLIASNILPSRFSYGSAVLEINRVISPCTTLHLVPAIPPLRSLGGVIVIIIMLLTLL